MLGAKPMESMECCGQVPMASALAARVTKQSDWVLGGGPAGGGGKGGKG